MGHPSLLAESIDIHQFLEQDRALRLSERLARDRSIGRELGAEGDVRRVLAWWRLLQSQSSALPETRQDASVGARLVQVRRWLTLGLVLVGALVGGSVCGLALGYDGSYPVNLLAFVGVMVGMPLFFLLLTLLAMAWRSFGFSSVTGLHLGQVNGWLMGLWQRLGGTHLHPGFGQSVARNRFAYWQVLQFSQVFAVGFFVGALVMFGVLVTVTDLAFGWSTTLELSPSRVHQWSLTLAAPWENVWPAAVPDTGLVEASRFYRLDSDIAQSRVIRLGQWWPFAFMMLLVWGLLPRLILLVLCEWRLASATAGLLREHSEVTALLDRMGAPMVALGQESQTRVEEVAEFIEISQLIDLSDAQIVVWNDAVAGAALTKLPESRVALSSLLSTADLQAAIAALPQSSRVAVMVKAWEPPVLEVLDVLQMIHRHAGPKARVMVVPVGTPDTARLPKHEDLQIWSQAVAKLKNPGIYVTETRSDLLPGEQVDG